MGSIIGTLLLASFFTAAQAQIADDSIVALSCFGEHTMTLVGGGPPTNEWVKELVLTVNFNGKIVTGFRTVGEIARADATTVLFSGRQSDKSGGSFGVSGAINRLTGAARVTLTSQDSDGKLSTEEEYDLTCKVAKRLF
jgi:hypothetical protein